MGSSKGFGFSGYIETYRNVIGVPSNGLLRFVAGDVGMSWGFRTFALYGCNLIRLQGLKNHLGCPEAFGVTDFMGGLRFFFEISSHGMLCGVAGQDLAGRMWKRV